MTVSSNDAKTGPYTGNGSTDAFAYDFYVEASTEIVVTLTSTASVDSTVSASDYSVSGVGSASGGNVTMDTPPALNEKLTITRLVPATQLVDLQNLGTVQPDIIEGALDKLTRALQDQQTDISSALKLSPSAGAVDLLVPVPVADRYLAWNAAANALENKDIASISAISVPVTIANGGTGAASASAALTALGIPYAKADLASATNMTIPTTGNYFDVTGTTTIVTMPIAANRHFFLQFDGALTLTHHATNLDLPSGANITTAAGDVAEFYSIATDDVHCVNYTRANGTAIVGATLAAAQTWTGPQRGTVTDIGSQASTVTVNLDTSNNHKVTLTGNAAFASPTGLDADAVGQCGSIFIIQDAGGTNAPSFNAAYDFIGGTAPTMTSTGDAVDRLDYIVVSPTRLQCVVTLAYS